MDRRLSRESKGSSQGLQKKRVGAETRRGIRPKEEHVRDLTDFMNDMFFGTADMDKKTYDLTGGNGGRGRGSRGYYNNNNHNNVIDDDDFGFDDSRRSNSGRLTQGWLDEARRVLASSPSGSESPGRRLVGSPRFAAASSQHGRSPLMALDRRDPLSRSARRNKAEEGLLGEEILSKSSKLSRNKSDTFTPPPPLSPSPSPLHSPSSSPSHNNYGHGSPPTPPHLWFSSSNPNNDNNPPRPRKSRFQAQSQAQPNNSPNPAQQAPPLRSFSHSLPLSPPRHPIESSHRRSRSSSTCSLEVIADSISNGAIDRSSINGFLKQQRTSLLRILNRGLANVKVTIVLSGHSNSAASMVAAICHAWLLSYRQREENGAATAAAMAVVVPVMNVKRGAMWKRRQAAWLFSHAGLDAAALLFSDEFDSEKLMTGQLNVLVVGQDILCATGEVGSQCTILIDHFCEDAYDLLQDPVLKKLLLAGILLDTQNLKASASVVTMTRDAEAVRLLLVGSAPNYRNALFDQLMQEQKGSSFVEVLNNNYGKPPDEGENSEENKAHKIGQRMTPSTSDYEAIISSPRKNYTDTNGAKANKISPKSAKLVSLTLASPPVAARAETDSSRGKNTFFLAKWFGFSSK